MRYMYVKKKHYVLTKLYNFNLVCCHYIPVLPNFYNVVKQGLISLL
jgi:hypothetical protein